MSITILQLHKRASHEYKNIQDKFAINEANKCFALADGTTQSFNSETWAEIITKHFVANPTFENQKLISDFTNGVQEYKNSKFEFNTNPAKASLEKTKQLKGGTATFIGLQFFETNQFNVISCGDTNLFIIRKDKVEHFPYSKIEKLDANNLFINTEQLLQSKIDDSYFQSKTFEFENNDTILLATDALSRLLLKQPNIISELTAINDFETLHKFCLKYWEKKEMQEDDISAILIKVESKNQIKKIIPPNDFCFPEEKEPEFIPTSFNQQNNSNQFTHMQMQEIIRQFNGVANDFHQVKKKQKFHEILLMVAISLMFLNILCFFYFRPSADNSEKEVPKVKPEKSIIESINHLEKSMNDKIENVKKIFEKQIKDLTIQKEEEVKKEPKVKSEKNNQDTKTKSDKNKNEK